MAGDLTKTGVRETACRSPHSPDALHTFPWRPKYVPCRSKPYFPRHYALHLLVAHFLLICTLRAKDVSIWWQHRQLMILPFKNPIYIFYALPRESERGETTPSWSSPCPFLSFPSPSSLLQTAEARSRRKGNHFKGSSMSGTICMQMKLVLGSFSHRQMWTVMEGRNGPDF